MTSAVDPAIDPRVVRLVMRSLSPRAEERPADAARFLAELAKSAQPDAIDHGDTIQIRTGDFESGAFAKTYDVARAPVRHVADFAKGARPRIPRPKGPGIAKARATPLGFEPRLVGPDGHWLRLSGESKRWVVGRGRSADFVTPDPDMSREHFEVSLGSDGSFRVRDLDSKNGLFVNGSRAQSAPLRAGDELRAGATTLKFEV